MRRLIFLFCFSLFINFCNAQIKDSVLLHTDSSLRIKNLEPYITLHVDSLLNYNLEINRDTAHYYWFLKNSPVGLKIGKKTGLLTFKADKSYFLSGKLKYDYEYKISLSVQNLDNPEDRVDTSFTLLFFNTEIIVSKLNPTITNKLTVDEGDTVNFKIQCDNGSFPIDEISFVSNYAVKSLTPIRKCDDEFTWVIPFDFIKPGDKDKQKKVYLNFIGSTKSKTRDTTIIELTVRDNINYPQQIEEFLALQAETEKYITELKSSFRIVDKRIKKNKQTRTTFDLSSATTALGGTVFSSMPNKSQQTVGKILPSVGVALVPVKEATAPNSSYEQNSATSIRNSIKRLEYLLSENKLVGERDPDILVKTNRIKDELKQTRIQLIDIPMPEAAPNEKELDDYFNDPKVNKKYKMRRP